MNEAEISDALADVAAQRGGGTSTDRAGMSMRTLVKKEEREVAIRMLARLLSQPSFPAEPFAAEPFPSVAPFPAAPSRAASSSAGMSSRMPHAL